MNQSPFLAVLLFLLFALPATGRADDSRTYVFDGVGETPFTHWLDQAKPTGLEVPDSEFSVTIPAGALAETPESTWNWSAYGGGGHVVALKATNPGEEGRFFVARPTPPVPALGVTTLLTADVEDLVSATDVQALKAQGVKSLTIKAELDQGVQKVWAISPSRPSFGAMIDWVEGSADLWSFKPDYVADGWYADTVKGTVHVSLASIESGSIRFFLYVYGDLVNLKKLTIEVAPHHDLDASLQIKADL